MTREILKKYKSYTLFYTEIDNKFVYEIYNQDYIINSFESKDQSAYKLAREYFDSIKEL